MSAPTCRSRIKGGQTVTVRSQPCSSCPYRRDVPSGLWSADEYEKLIPYDNETPLQPFGGFACHATPEHFCNGWAVVGTHKADDCRQLISLRIAGEGEVPEESVPLFDSHSEAAAHGMRDIENMSEEAMERAAALLRKYPRLTVGQEQNPFHQS